MGPLGRDIAVRANCTSAGATGAWLVGRATGTRAHASTVGMTALVGAQLGQTILVGGNDPVVLAAGLGSAAILAGIVQTPGLSQLFGCRPLGPIGWSITTTASAIATAGAAVLPRVLSVLPFGQAGAAQQIEEEEEERATSDDANVVVMPDLRELVERAEA